LISSIVEEKAQAAWFDNTQKLLCDRQRWLDYDTLRKKVHYAYKKLCKEKGIDDIDVILLGRAYKLSNDIGKHGGKLIIPPYLWKKLPKYLHKYVDWHTHQS
jgi:hypothetical protein